MKQKSKKLGRYDFTKATWGEKLFAWSRQDEIVSIEQIPPEKLRKKWQ